MALQSVRDELSDENGGLDQASVALRVENWKERVSKLYEQLRAWLPTKFTTDTLRILRMHEKLMKRYNVGASILPILNVSCKGDSVATLTPRGLWIIGANGRLDLFTQQSHFVVVDRAMNFQTPDWEIAPGEMRRAARPLTRESWLAALEP